MKSLMVIGRRWFHRGPGNTYCTAEIFIDGERVHKTQMQYGYGDFYLQTAQEWLASKGRIRPKKYDNGGTEPLWQWADRRGVKFTHYPVDVSRKSAL